MRRLAVLPARGGSKRLPDKNVRDFCGKPMMAHILKAAQESGLFEVIHVSTDDANIADVASTLGFPPEFSRPDKLADDFTPIVPVLKYVAEIYKDRGEEFDQIWLLMACSPLIEACDLQGAATKMDSRGGERPIITVALYPAPIEWAFDLESDGSLTPLEPGKFEIRSQDLKAKYFDTGSFIGFPASFILDSDGAGSDSQYMAYVLSPRKAIDIDDAEDWAFAEAIYRGVKSNHE